MLCTHLIVSRSATCPCEPASTSCQRLSATCTWSWTAVGLLSYKHPAQRLVDSKALLVVYMAPGYLGRYDQVSRHSLAGLKHQGPRCVVPVVIRLIPDSGSISRYSTQQYAESNLWVCASRGTSVHVLAQHYSHNCAALAGIKRSVPHPSKTH